ncbi:hypothetical protein [Microbacterium aurantiacum]|uniref:hypothetical protein n=1 Tax=Microbacterium aurantiacum TaxID=162393 RepID=UPI001F24E0DA|nr:hypothetical protein [Microbacterium aurantiacum]
MTAGDLWQQRFIQYDNQARILQTKVFELIAIGLTAVSALSGVAISYSRYEFFAFIPIICLLLWAIAARMLHEHLILSAFRDFCEARAVMLLGTSNPSAFDSWREFGGQRAMKGWPNYFAFSVVAAVTLGLMAGSMAFLFTVDVVPVGWLLAESIALGVVLLIGVVVFVVAMVDHSRLERLVANEIERLR